MLQFLTPEVRVKHRFAVLRGELVAAYMAASFDPDKIAAICKELTELLPPKRPIKFHNRWLGHVAPLPGEETLLRAVLVAIQETGAPASQVFDGVRNLPAGRARMYVIMALYEVCLCSPTAITQRFHCQAGGPYVFHLRHLVTKNKLTWWRPSVYDRVKAALLEKTNG